MRLQESRNQHRRGQTKDAGVRRKWLGCQNADVQGIIKRPGVTKRTYGVKKKTCPVDGEDDDEHDVDAPDYDDVGKHADYDDTDVDVVFWSGKGLKIAMMAI